MARKPLEQDDPMEMVGVVGPTVSPEEQAAMAEALVEEFVRMGWDDPAILAAFANPFFQLPHRVWQEQGEEAVRALLNRVRERWGRLRYRTVVHPSEEPDSAFVPVESLDRLDRA